MQLVIDLLGVGLAIGGLVDVWKNGSLFAEARADVESRQDVTDPESWWQWLWELLLCSFCQTYQLGIWLFLALTISDRLPWGSLVLALTHYFDLDQWLAWTALIPYGDLFRAAVFGVAAARFSWIVNGLLPAHLRYDRARMEESDARPATHPAAPPHDGDPDDGESAAERPGV